MAKWNIPSVGFEPCVPLVALRDDLLAYTKHAEPRFLSDSQVELLLTIVSLGRVACLEVPHVATLAARPPTERPNVPFGNLGSVCGVARRMTPQDSTACEFYAPFVALPLSTRSHFSLLIVDHGDQRAYHFDSQPGLHNDMLDALLMNNWHWMMPTAAGDAPTVEQLRARTTLLYHRQTSHNCGVAVARVMRYLELRMSELPSDFAIASKRPALMRNVFEVAMADDSAVEAYRVRLAEAMEDFTTLHVASSLLAADAQNASSPLRALMLPGIGPAAAVGYTSKTRVEANLFVTWLRTRFVWFNVFSTLSAAALVQVLDSGMPALMVNCSTDGSTVFGVAMLVPPSPAHAEWILAGTTFAVCMVEQTLSTRLHEIAGGGSERYAYTTARISEQMDQLTPLVLGVAAAIDARLWNAESNQRGWAAAHAADTVLQSVKALNEASTKRGPEQRERNAKLSPVLANGCYGLLARQMHEHVRHRMTKADKLALAREGMTVGTAARPDAPSPVEIRRRVLRRQQDDFIDRLTKLSIPQLEMCYNDAASVYNHVANTRDMLDLVREVEKYVQDSTEVGLAIALLYDILALLAHSVPMLWLHETDDLCIMSITHADDIGHMLVKRYRPVPLPIYVFHLHALHPVGPSTERDGHSTRRTELAYDASETETAAQPVQRELRTLAGIWTLPTLIQKISSGEAVPSTYVPALSSTEGARILKMLGTCIMWPSASDAPPTGSIDFGAFVSCITTHPALAQLQCYEGRYPWICLDAPSV